MPATAKNLSVGEKDLSTGQGGAYALLEVPADVVGYLKDTDDWKPKEFKSGWVLTFSVFVGEEELEFKWFLSHAPNVRWKIVKTWEAFGVEVEEGVLRGASPDQFLGDAIGLHIDFDRNKKGEVIGSYRNIQDVFPLGEDDEEEPEADDVPKTDTEEEGEEPDVL